MTRSTSLLCAALLLACGPQEAEVDRTSSAAPPEAPPARPEPPQLRDDTIRIEGTAHPIQVQRYRSPEDFPLAFESWVPTDMQPEVDAEAEERAGAGLRFIANFAARRSPEAFVHIFVYPAGTALQEVLSMARAFVQSRGVPVSQGEEAPAIGPDSVAAQPWTVAQEGFRLQVGANQWLVGTIAIGQHAGRYFHVVTQYPTEFGEGFEPRAGVILRNWRWLDSGTPLGT